MRKRQKRILVCCLLGIMMAAWTGCGNGEESKQAEKTDDVSAKGQQEQQMKQEQQNQDAAETEELMYEADYGDFSADVDSVEHFYYRGGRIYMCGNKYIQKAGKNKTYIMSCKADGSDIQQTECMIDEKEQFQNIFSVRADGTMQLITAVYNEEEGSYHYFIRLLNEKGEGTEKYQLLCSKENEYLNQFIITDDGMVYAMGITAVYCFDAEGKEIKKIELNDGIYIQSIVKAGDSVYACYRSEQNWMIQELDMEAETLGKAIPIENLFNLRGIKEGNGSQILVDSGVNLYRLDPVSGTLEMLLNWINVGIDGDCLRDYAMTGDESVFAVTYPMGEEDAQHEYIVLNQTTDSSQKKEKKVLTLACTAMRGNMKKNILKFNRTNQNYQIQVKDYQDYEDYTTKLNLDIISGKVPDIICMSGLPQDVYAKKGILTDLYPWIEQDSEIQKEDFLESVLKAAETDGKLYSMGASFSIQSIYAGGKDNIGESGGWTLEEMQKLYSNMPENGLFMMGMSRQWFLENIVSRQMDELIHWSTGEVNFDSDTFIQCLEFSKNFPDDLEANTYYNTYVSDMKKLLKKGKVMLLQGAFSQWTELEQDDILFQPAGGCIYRSYPTSDGDDAVGMAFYDPAMAITEQCDEKEGAWEFVRMFLEYDYQVKLYNQGFLNYGFPTRKDALEKHLEYVKAKEAYVDEDGTEVTPLAWGSNYYDIDIEYGPLSDKQETVIRELIDRIGFLAEDLSSLVFTKVTDIVKEEAAAFFAGDKTAEETADIIHRRVKLYVNETL